LKGKAASPGEVGPALQSHRESIWDIKAGLDGKFAPRTNYGSFGEWIGSKLKRVFHSTEWRYDL